MLDGLDDIQWSKLTHAYGTAEDIPEYLRKLSSDDPDVLKRTFTHLYNCLYHQSTIYEASVAAIPFLIDLLQEKIKSKASIIHLLSHLAHGDYLRSFNFWMWDHLARSEVAKGLSTYLSLLDDENSRVRIQTVAILSYSPRFTEDEAQLILDSLMNRLDTEEHELVVSAIIFGLGYMIAGYRSLDDNTINLVASRVEGIYEEVSNPKTRLVTLLSLPKILGEKTPQYMIDELLKVIETPPFPTTPANKASPDFYALESLWHLDKIRCKKSLEIALQRSNSSIDILIIASALMEWLYAGKGPSLPSRILDVDGDGNRKYIYRKAQPQFKPDKLTDFQRQVVQTILNTDTAWEIQHNLLEYYGLPAGREEARQFLAQG